MNRNIVWGATVDTITGQLAVETAGSPLVESVFRLEDLIVGISYEATDWVESLDLMSLTEVTNLMDLDSVRNPLLAELWRDDVNDGLIDGS